MTYRGTGHILFSEDNTELNYMQKLREENEKPELVLTDIEIKYFPFYFKSNTLNISYHNLLNVL